MIKEAKNKIGKDHLAYKSLCYGMLRPRQKDGGIFIN